MPLFATRRSLSRHKPKPGRKVATAFELFHRWRQGLDGQGADRTHTRHGLQAAGCLAFPGNCVNPFFHGIDPGGQVHGLIQQLTTGFPGQRWQVQVSILYGGAEAREIAASFGNVAELVQVRPQRVDRFGALLHELFAGAEQDESRLLSPLFGSTWRMVGRKAACKIASASDASFFCRSKNGLT